MIIKEYGYLMKTLVPKKGPDGLYPEPCVWMEGKDLEGFNAHFSYGFIKKPCSLHSIKGALVHPYNELLVFAGTDNANILNLGAEISVELGEEREVHTFTDPSVIIVPKGMPHGPVTVKNISRPIVHFTIGLSPTYKAAPLPADSQISVNKGAKYTHFVKKLITYFMMQPPPTVGLNQNVGSGMGYEKVIFNDGVMRPALAPKEALLGPGNADELVWLYGKDLEGFDVNFTWGFYTKCGKWHRGGEAHTHPEEEILCFVGLDPDNPDYLGAELELGMGKDYERHIFNKPTVAICPKGFPHLPLITRWVDKPYAFFVICLNGEHESPWVEA